MLKIQSAGSSSLGNSYKISSVDSFLLIEAGVKLKDMREAFGYDISAADGCLCTHLHKDHCQYLPEIAKLGVEVYCSQETANNAGIANSPFFNRIEHRKEFFAGQWQVYPVAIEHDCEGAFAFHVIHGQDRLLFITDTGYFRYLFPKINYLVIEANFSQELIDRNAASGGIDASRRRRTMASHLSISRVKDFIRDNDTSCLREVHLIHLSAGNSDENMFKEEVQKLTGVPVYVHSE